MKSICGIGYKFEIWEIPSWLETPWWYFLIFYTPKKYPQNEMTIKGIFFMFTYATIPRKMHGYMKGILSYLKFIFKMGYRFIFKIYR